MGVHAASHVEHTSRDPNRRGLFYWLIPATLIPFVAFPLFAYVLPEGGVIHQSRELLIFIGSSGHVAASFFFYTDHSIRGHMREHRLRYFAAPLALVLGTAAIYAFSDRSLLSYVAIGYWIWQTYHYARQNHGVLAFVSKAEGMGVERSERVAIELTGIAGSIGMITFVTPYDQTVLAPYAWHIHHLALAVYAAAWAFGLYSLSARRGTPLRTFMFVLLLLFFAPLFVFENSLAAVSGYAIAHGLQYLVFMSYVATVPRSARIRNFVKLVLIGLGGGIFLYTLAAGPMALGSWRLTIFGGYLGFVMWHFVLDAGVWRLSQPFQRAYMSERFACLRAPASQATMP